MGRRLGRRQRPDPRRPRRRCRRRRAAARQLHRASPAAASRSPAILGGQVSVGINGLAEFAAQIEAGTVRALADLERRAPARARRADAARAGRRRRVRELALASSRRPASRADERARLEARSTAMVRSRRMARAARALPLARSLSRRRRVRARSRPPRKRACARSCASSARASATARRSRPARIRCSCSRASLLFGVAAARRRAARAPSARRARRARSALAAARASIGAGVVAAPAARRARRVRRRRGGAVLAHRARLRSRVIRCATRVCALGVAVGSYVLFARVLQLPLPAGVARRAGSDAPMEHARRPGARASRTR